MKTTIFYFSGTGNSLEIARDLASELGGAEVVPIQKVINGPEIDAGAEKIGIVYPVYMFGMPLIVTDFLRKLKADRASYIFAVANYGGMAGGALEAAANELKKRGLGLSAGFGLLMPGNYAPLYGAIPAARQEAMFRKEKEHIKKIAETVRRGEKAGLKKSLSLFNMVSGLFYKLCVPKMRSMDKDFWADDKCNGCGVCEKVCPVCNIRLSNGRPAWLHKCEQCMACLQWCPEEAIQFGKKTAGRKRYRNPNVMLKDFLGVQSK